MANGLFNLPPLIGDDEKLKQWMLDDLRETYNPQSNMNNPAYVQGVTAVRPYNVYTDKEGAGIAGYVDTFKAPTTVNLSTPYLSDATRVFAHEVAHVQKNIADRQVSKDKQNDTIAQALQRSTRGEEGAALRQQLEANFVNYVKSLNRVPDRGLEKLVGAYGVMGKNAPWEERFADLQSLESQLPRGKSLLDTPLGQNVFNTPELKRYWLQTTLPLQAKALEQNPELQENFFDKLEIFRQTFKDEARTRSFANAALSALKKAYKGRKEEVVNPMYRDPFGDTTK
jgi:hypothetical protein